MGKAAEGGEAGFERTGRRRRALEWMRAGGQVQKLTIAAGELLAGVSRRGGEI